LVERLPDFIDGLLLGQGHLVQIVAKLREI